MLLPLTAFALGLTPPAVANTYDISFKNAVHHEATITVRFDALPAGPLTLRMARSSPGRYALHEFAKNVDDVSAVDASGKSLAVVRPDPYSWTVAGDHDGAVIVTYTLFGDRTDGTYAQIDTSHAHLNGPASLMWADGLFDRHAVVRIKPLREDWKVATQLIPTGDPYVFTAPSGQYLMDSPIEVSDHEMRSWQVSHQGETATIRMALHSNASKAQIDDYEAKIRKIVDEEIAFWDDIPDYDNGTYTFLFDYLPWDDGDGMEHRNSTVITGRREDGSEADLPTNVVAHEFFHGWNVERLRPADLEPFDFTRADVSQHLWLAEGFTSYLDGILSHRAGVASMDDTLSGLASSIRQVSGSPAIPGSSAAEMSRLAPFMDAATSNDPTNDFNSKLSYYTYGAAIGLALDLTLRTRFDSSLDDYFRALWQRFGKTEIAYTDRDLVDTLASVTGDRTFAEQFFADTVHGDAVPDFAPLLAAFGLVLRPENPGKGTLGLVALAYDDGRATLAYPSLRGTPIYQAGLSRDDEIVLLDGRAIDSAEDWKAASEALVPGQQVTIGYIRRGQAGETSVAAGVDDRLEIVSVDRPTSKQRAMREAWLGSSQ